MIKIAYLLMLAVCIPCIAGCVLLIPSKGVVSVPSLFIILFAGMMLVLFNQFRRA